MKGKVYLVGAGPGDPGLITAKGLDCIKKADVLIYDYLASPTLLPYAPETAERIYVGKKAGDHTLSQDGINALIIEKAKAGKIVTRLKGGDPFIFGRGGEEAEVLAAEDIAFEIVPGITSAIAAPAYAGIPLTHRDFTPTVAFITGHEDPKKERSGIDWTALSKGIGTLVFLMGVKNLPNIVNRLIDHGRAPHTPVALVRWGTTANQETVTGTLETIVQNAEKAGIKAPAVIVVGDVVQLRQSLKWFEAKPLSGKQIVVTRARHQASDLVRRLSELGAVCIECPTIRIEPPPDWKAIDAAIAALDHYQWLIFTSVNGVQHFFDRLIQAGKDARALGHLQLAVIGPATEKKLSDYGLYSDIVPETYRAESVVKAFKDVDLQGVKVLLPRAEEARPLLPKELEKRGAIVDEIAVYRTHLDADSAQPLIESLSSKSIDMVTFTSSSTVKNFKALLPPDQMDTLMEGVKIASIGPITTETAEKIGFRVDVTAPVYTIPGLCEAILRYYNDRC